MQQSEFRQGWGIILAASLALAVGLPTILFHTLGVFAPALIGQFGWKMGQLQAGLACMSIMMLLSGPMVGFMADRYGVRRVGLTSLPLLGVNVMAFSLMTGNILQFYVLCSAVAVLGAGATAIVWTRAVNRSFSRRRGLALGLTLSGSGLFALVAKPGMAAVIAGEGWRTAYFVLGAVPIVALPIVYFFTRERPTRQAETASGEPSADARQAAPLTGLTVPQALGHWRFWLLFVALIPIAFATAGPMPNLERIFMQHGFDMARAVMMTALIGVSIIIGRLASGWLFDRFWAPGVAALVLLLPTASDVILAQDTLTLATGYLAVALLGFGAGAEYDLLAYLVARYIGLYRYGSIYGVLYSAFAVVGGSAPMAYGGGFDRWGSYGPILTVSAVAMALSAVAMLFLGRYPDFEVPEQAGGVDLVRA